MIVDELRSLQERARDVEGHQATRLAEVHERIVRARRRRAAVLGSVVAVLVLGVVAVAAQPERDGAVTPSDRIPPPVASDTSGVPEVGYPGLPPDNAAPSRPGAAELVLHYAGPGDSSQGWADAWVWADGRFIAQWNIPWYSSSPPPKATGLVERRLTDSGVEALRSYALDPGHPPPGPPTLPEGAALEVREGERLVELRPNTVFPERILGPENWLPETAWVDPTPRAYAATRFAVCLKGHNPGRTVPTSEVRGGLPRHVADKLRSLVPHADAPVDGLECAAVTASEARTMAAALDRAWLDRDDHLPFLMDVVFVHRESATLRDYKTGDSVGYVGFYPMLPDGRFTCMPCG